jgi:hypothetical protein
VFTVLRLLARVAGFLWLAGVVLACFVAPLYLLAVDPETPAPLFRVLRQSIPAEALSNFWYRLAVCAGLVGLGFLLLLRVLRGKKSAAERRGSSRAA